MLVLAQAALVQYLLTTRLPLGADLYGYSAAEVGETLRGGLTLKPAVLWGLGAALATLALGLRRLRTASLRPGLALAVLGAGIGVMALAPSAREFPRDDDVDARNLKISTLAYFVHDTLAYFAGPQAEAPVAAAAPAAVQAPDAVAAPVREPAQAPDAVRAGAPDPRYPFLHAERTPDVLGPLFRRTSSGAPPSLVFVVVEGLGRDFSGPGARLGSFTPNLDRLAERSLYFENFLAPQGRTFAVLPSLFGSLPFADQGFAQLGERMPAHQTLLSVLAPQGYRLRAYMGDDASFDNERGFLERQGLDRIVDRSSFGPGYAVANAWGYADGELVARALEGERQAPPGPAVTLIQTVSSHTPYTFPGQAAYAARLEQRLDALAVPEERRDAYRAAHEVYETLLYVDDALGRFFDEAQQEPAFRDTIFVVVGDHRLPEIPMATWIERYHVPLIVWSPLLKAPARIKSVSSQFDLAPSLLAYLAHEYGLRTPRAVTWLGTGLDLEPTFRNVHDLPLMLSKHELVDYVSGEWMLSQGRLYAIGDGLDLERSTDAQALARLSARFAAFRAANERLARGGALMPAGAADLVTYDEGRTAPGAATAAAAALSVRDLRVPGRASAGALVVEAVFANGGAAASAPFVPLVVLADADGREISESYGTPLSLAPGEARSVRLPVKSAGVAPGRYYLSVFPFDVGARRRAGAGRFHVAVELEAAAP